MSRRQYPNADRALRQIQRHDEEAGPFVPPAPPSEFQIRLAEQANAALGVARDTVLRPLAERLARQAPMFAAAQPDTRLLMEAFSAALTTPSARRSA